MRKSTKYRRAVEWIALNDNSASDDRADEVAEYVTAALVADLFLDGDTGEVGRDVVARRAEIAKEEGRS